MSTLVLRRLTVNPSTRLIVPAWVGAVPHPVSSEDGWGGRQGDVKDLSLADRMEVTKKYAKAHQTASKKDKTRILDQVVAVTGRNRDHVCQQLRRRDGQSSGSGRRDDRGRRSMPILVSIPATPDSCWDGVGRHGCQRPVPIPPHQPAAPAGTAVDQPAPKPVAARRGANQPRRDDGSTVYRLGGANPGRRASRAKRAGADVGSAAGCRF